MLKAKVDLVAFLEQAAGQVYGGDERALLQDWLGRNTSGQVVEIDLDAVVQSAELPTSEGLDETVKEEIELGDLEAKLIERIGDWIQEAADTDVVIMQVQPTSAVAEMAAQAAAMVLMAFERGYRLGGGDGDGIPDVAG